MRIRTDNTYNTNEYRQIQKVQTNTSILSIRTQYILIHVYTNQYIFNTYQYNNTYTIQETTKIQTNTSKCSYCACIGESIQTRNINTNQYKHEGPVMQQHESILSCQQQTPLVTDQHRS